MRRHARRRLAALGINVHRGTAALCSCAVLNTLWLPALAILGLASERPLVARADVVAISDVLAADAVSIADPLVALVVLLGDVGGRRGLRVAVANTLARVRDLTIAGRAALHATAETLASSCVHFAVLWIAAQLSELRRTALGRAVRVRNANDARAVGLLREWEVALLCAGASAASVVSLNLLSARRAIGAQVNQLSVNVNTGVAHKVGSERLDETAATMTRYICVEANKLHLPGLPIESDEVVCSVTVIDDLNQV